MNEQEIKTWLLTHAGVESEYNRNLIYNTLKDEFTPKTQETKKVKKWRCIFHLSCGVGIESVAFYTQEEIDILKCYSSIRSIEPILDTEIEE